MVKSIFSLTSHAPRRQHQSQNLKYWAIVKAYLWWNDD